LVTRFWNELWCSGRASNILKLDRLMADIEYHTEMLVQRLVGLRPRKPGCGRKRGDSWRSQST
jgi:hypothetical protein